MTGEPKIYLLDTSVLLHRPEAIFSFGGNQVVIPVVVLDELDNFKRGSMEINRNARHVIGLFDELRSRGAIFEGVTLDNGGQLKVDTERGRSTRAVLPQGFEKNADNYILATAVGIKEDTPGRKVILVTKDINMRVKAEALGLLAEDYRADQLVDPDEMYTGHAEVVVPQDMIDQMYKEKTVSVNGSLSKDQTFYPNQFLMLVSADSPSITALTRYDGDNLELLRDPPSRYLGDSPPEPRAALRRRAFARRQRAVGHPGWKGRNRKDHPGHRGGAAESGQRQTLPAPIHLPARGADGARHRLSARHRAREVNPVDAADL
jgi:predicted ribonuclease YlaK